MDWQSGPRARVGLVLAVALSGALAVPACDALLLGDRHVGACDEGDRRCVSGNTLQTCDPSGQWSRGILCEASTCNPDAGQCEGECAPGATRCGGETPEGCDPGGRWEGGLPCDADAGERCSGGACVVTCTSGDLRCLDDDTPQACDHGDWQDAGSCDPCQQCDPTTGKCRTSYLPDDSPCHDPQNRCILGATCQSHKCLPVPGAGQVECVAAGVCSPGACDPETGTCAAGEGASCPAGDSCTVSSACQAGVCASATSTPIDHAWAHWDPRLAPGAPPPSPRYTWTGGVVLDHVSGLTWQRVVPITAYTPKTAEDYCACRFDGDSPCKIPGYPSGWRLPTRIELASIVDYAQVNPSIDPAAFPGTDPVYFGTSSSCPGGGPGAWIVLFADGSVYCGSALNTVRVRCVR